MGKLPYDPVKDLAPVAKLADIPIVVAVANSTPVGSVQDLIAAAKAKPGGLAFGSAGNGTAMHLSGELFKLMAGRRHDARAVQGQRTRGRPISSRASCRSGSSISSRRCRRSAPAG